MINGDTAPPTFEFGLVLAGAVSAGAYTAGVVDFLLEALDAWDGSEGDHEGRPHRVLLKVMSGASAGAMTAALATVAVNSETTPVRDVDSPPPPERNRLYDAWVRRIDVRSLLGTKDLEGEPKLVSLLDSSELARIAEDGLDMKARAQARAWVVDPMPVLLTVANLRGVPYAFHLAGSRGNSSYGMLSHADHVAFAASRAGNRFDGALPLDPVDLPNGDGWVRLAQAALASGAFPVGLTPRALDRPFADYEKRLKRPPHWPTPPPADPYRLLCVDGGLMNNEPLELARLHLAQGGRNPRSGEQAHRAVIMVDPFPNQDAYDPAWAADDRLVKVVQALFAALVDQARFKPEELELAEDPDVYSRFVISPTREGAGGEPVEPAMASAILGGFGGFLSETFRKHDFQLGRRNGQQFLRRHFCLPETNGLFRAWSEEAKQEHCVRESDGTPARYRGGEPTRLLPIVPLLGKAAREVPQRPAPRAAEVDLEALGDRLGQRILAVGHTFIDTDGASIVGGGPLRWLMHQAFQRRFGPRLRKKAMTKIRQELARLDA
jgi:hypothetical protein